MSSIRQHGRPIRELLAGYVGLLLVVLLLMGLFGALSRNFLTVRTVVTVANQIPDLTVVAVGMTLVLVAGGIDLSVGSVMALSAGLLGVAMVDWKWPLGAAIPLALLGGIGCGAVNGAICVGWRIPSFIVTLGMLEVARGAAYLITESQTKYIGARIEPLGESLPHLGASPAFLIALAAVVGGQLVLTRTVFGRYLVAIGTNEQAVRLSGIDPRPTRLAVFVAAGGLAGVAGLFQASRLSSADPNGGVGMELSAIAAVVIGGTSLSGGRGSVVGSFLGVLLIAVLQTGLAQVGATEPVKRLITGLVIVGAVVADAYRSRLLRSS